MCAGGGRCGIDGAILGRGQGGLIRIVAGWVVWVKAVGRVGVRIPKPGPPAHRLATCENKEWGYLLSC